MPSYVMLFPVIVLSSAFVEIDRYAYEKQMTIRSI